MPENRKETVMFLCRKAVSSEQYRPLSEREAVLFDGHQKVYKGVYRHLTRFESPLHFIAKSPLKINICRHIT